MQFRHHHIEAQLVMGVEEIGQTEDGQTRLNVIYEPHPFEAIVEQLNDLAAPVVYMGQPQIQHAHEGAIPPGRHAVTVVTEIITIDTGVQFVVGEAATPPDEVLQASGLDPATAERIN